MKKLLFSIATIGFLFSGMVSPMHSAFAQTPPGGVITPDPGGVINPDTGGHIDPGDGSPGGATFDFHISNPVTGFDNLPDLIVALLEIVMLIAMPIIAVLIIYAGFLFATARGDTGKLKTAKETLLYVVIGAAIILGAKVIAEAIQGTINSLM